MKKNFLPCFMAIILLMASLVTTVSAFSAEENVQGAYNNNDIIPIAHRGDWHSFPENSAEAIKAGSVYGIVSVDVRVTGDKEIILMADTTTDRMVVDKNGNAVKGNIKDMVYADLAECFLRSGNGGSSKAKTGCRIATLKDALDASDGKTALMINLSVEDFDDVFSCIKKLNALDKVIFRFSGSTDKMLKAVGNRLTEIHTTGNYQGNIIFLATTAHKKCTDKKIGILELGSANGHGVLYDQFLMKRFNKDCKAMVSMVNGRCGDRTDNEKGWDDLISRGYSIIETDYPEELKAYLDKTESAKKDLIYYYDLYRNTELKEFTTETEDAFTSALAEADKHLNSSASLSELQNSRFALQSAYDNLTTGPKKTVKLDFEFSFGRAAAVILCGAALLISQIFLFKHRVK